MSQSWFTNKQAMQYLSISRSTLYRLVAKGKLTQYQIEGTEEKRYAKEELDKLLKPVNPQEKERN